MPINATKKPIYESFSMIHLDGTFMCHINGKRANWYVEKGLAEWIDEKTFQLKFEPKGKGKKDLLFYNQKLENRCVVCGNDHQDELNKHHVVPSVFRSRFPIQYKESNHHDVLVTCLDCHENYEHEAMLYKIELVKEAGFVMNIPMTPEQKKNKKVIAARNVISKVLSGELIDEFGNCLVPKDKMEILQKIANIELLPDDSDGTGAPWADKLVEKILKENTLFEFVKNWRQHFIDHTNPQFLPEYWSVEHPLEISKVD